MADTTLDARARTRGLTTVMAASFLMHAGFFLIIPLLSVHYVDKLGWAAAFIGVVLAVRQFMQQGLTVFGGALADRFGAKGLIMLGLLIRVASFVVMGYATTPALLLFSGVLAAVGGALYDAPQKAVIAALATVDRLPDYYAKNGIFMNVAQSVGPLVGALLVRFDFTMVGLGAAVFFFCAFLVIVAGLPAVDVSTEKQRVSAGLKLAAQDRAFVTFTLLMMGYWFMWVQLSIAMPLVAKHLTGSDSSVAALLTVNSIVAVVLQVPALRLAQRYLRPLPTLIAGMLLMAFGLATVAGVQSQWHLYASVSFFALGSVLVMPTSQTVAAAMASPRARGAYMGVNSLALAFGGGLGHVAGGALVDTAAAFHLPALPWLTFALVGGVAAYGLSRFYAHHRARVALQPAYATTD